MIFQKPDGTPYKTLNTVNSVATRKGFKNCRIVEVTGGWVIETLEAEGEEVEYKDALVLDGETVAEEEEVEEEEAPVVSKAPTPPIPVVALPKIEPVPDPMAQMSDEECANKSYTSGSHVFTPAKLLDMHKKFEEPGWGYRWCNTKKEGNIEKKLQEGWEIDRGMSKHRDKLGSIYRDNTYSSGTETRMRELLLMRIPLEMSESRKAYYRDLSKAQVARNTGKDLNADMDGSMYGKVDVQKQ